MTVVAEAPTIICPSWCTRTDHSADVVDEQNPEHHYGPDFGALSVEAVGSKKPYVLTYESVGNLSASGLRELAAGALAAAEWLEAQA